MIRLIGRYIQRFIFFVIGAVGFFYLLVLIFYFLGLNSKNYKITHILYISVIINSILGVLMYMSRINMIVKSVFLGAICSSLILLLSAAIVKFGI